MTAFYLFFVQYEDSGDNKYYLLTSEQYQQYEDQGFLQALAAAGIRPLDYESNREDNYFDRMCTLCDYLQANGQQRALQPGETVVGFWPLFTWY